MATVNRNIQEIKRGILGPSSGANTDFIVQINDVIRIKPVKVKRRSGKKE